MDIPQYTKLTRTGKQRREKDPDQESSSRARAMGRPLLTGAWYAPMLWNPLHTIQLVDIE